jgi:exosortase/archaeosortase family protein
MTKASLRRKRHSPSGKLAGLVSWFSENKPVILYAGKFAGLVLFFTILSLTSVYQAMLLWETEWIANVAHDLLAFIPGGASSIKGATLFRGAEPILEVNGNCSGLSLCWLFCSAVLAFPAGIGWRMVGVLLGSSILIGWNILRIAVLFLIGSYEPGLFTMVHDQFWPVLSLVFLAILLAIWLQGLKAPLSKANK